MGGDCTWTGCIPSKTLLKAAQVAEVARTAIKYGIVCDPPRIDFPAVMRRVDSVRRAIYRDADAPEVYERLGVRVFPARAKFTGPHALQLSDGHSVTSRYFLIATGSRPLLPKVEGLDAVQHYTSESIFEIERLPSRLIVVGAGPQGVELAQAFQRLGSKVTVVEASHRVLGRDDADLSYLLEQSLRREGIEFLFGATVAKLESDKVEGNITAHLTGGVRLQADAILFATGREVDTSDLDLRAAGIRVTEYGISVDDRCRTAVKHIYAAGDVTGRPRFTHMAEHMAKVAMLNALVGKRSRLDEARLPWCTFCDPELARVGASEDQLRNRDVRFDVFKFPYARLDRAITDGEESGLIKVFTTPPKGRILGVTILGARAGDMIAEWSLALRHEMKLRDITSTLHPYPSYAFGNRRAADQWLLSRRSSTVLWALKLFRGLRGRVPAGVRFGE
jgi:pyruvate/2-oxoglutarate dehydrogenase complex dihydrolipoamide dehydrogenase (E3) component